MPYSLQVVCGFFYVPLAFVWTVKGCEMGPTVYSPYLRRLELLIFYGCYSYFKTLSVGSAGVESSRTHNLPHGSLMLNHLRYLCAVIRYPNTSKLVKRKSPVPRFFNPLLSIWLSDKTVFNVFDTLHWTFWRVNFKRHREFCVGTYSHFMGA